ncbi:hypothetical protein SAMN05192533_12911 [Mesobacillus persicus]|uniref:Lipoprotein n=1 Tax=Mesobacillus persicus TaxID=930146 RepID=A0A1H8KMY5_9BACI|nr:hypothetical protein [Mesobacillus persicus]SEN94234.1 hypothetical protein SAMN05192533_12911 [Mesobacillus persicus]
MKTRTKILYFSMAFLMLVGCADNANEETKAEPSVSENGSVVEVDGNEKSIEDTNDGSTEEAMTDSDDASSEKKVEEKDLLSQYSSEQIEYARVWLQLGPNQELDELNVWHIAAGEPLNPDDETSATYREDVIQLAGSRLIDGSVTYSGNGDGTINVYNVPLRWDGVYPAGEEFYTEIINNTKLVYVDPGDDKKIIELIKLQIVHN